MSFSLNHLQKLQPSERFAYVQEHLDEYEALTQKQKDRVGTLLCHASSEEAREEHPIISDLRADPNQEKFEQLLPEHGPLDARDIVLGRLNVKA